MLGRVAEVVGVLCDKARRFCSGNSRSVVDDECDNENGALKRCAETSSAASQGSPSKHQNEAATAHSKLREQYTYIGTELLKLELDLGIYSTPSEFVRREFQRAAVFVPTEVLESYLDDLLSASVPYARLGLGKKRSHFPFYLLLTASFIVAILLGLFAVHSGFSIAASLGFICLVSLPLVIGAFCIPQVAFARRLKFARLVSAEVTRRRGGDSQGRLRPMIPSKVFGPEPSLN